MAPSPQPCAHGTKGGCSALEVEATLLLPLLKIVPVRCTLHRYFDGSGYHRNISCKCLNKDKRTQAHQLQAKITSTCLTTGKIIYDFSCKYQDAPRNILAISTEATVISASLAQIQALILSKENPEQVLHSRPEIAATLDTSLTGCMVLFSCLDQELRDIKRDAHRQGREKLSFKGKIKTVWKQETFQELLDGIRGQQLAINTLIQLLQMYV